jgi:hypothetical protein
MAILRESLLFQWRDIDSADDLSRFLLVRDNLPDARLVDFLEKRRGKGRDDYPVRPMWNLVLAGVVFQHPSAAALLREASRNPALREACGFNPFPRKRLKKVEGKWVEVMEAEVPSDDAFGRFLALLIEHRSLIDDMFHACLDELAALLPDLGEKLAVDSKAIQSAGKPVKDEEKQETPDGRRDLDADWGKKEYKGTRKDGTPFEKVVTWFGYKLHLLVDSKYEMPLAFKLTKASAADGPELLPLIEQHEERNPETASRADEVAADKAYDSKENNEALYDDRTAGPSSTGARPRPSASSVRAAPNVRSARLTASAPLAASSASPSPLTAASSRPSPATPPNGKTPMTVEPLSSASTRASTGCSALSSTSFAARPRWRCACRWR